MTYRELLAQNANVRRLWTGQVVSEIGDWFNNIAVLALTIQLAGKGSEGQAVALYAIARHLPLFIFGPLAGVVVDRASRRRVMIAADLSFVAGHETREHRSGDDQLAVTAKNSDLNLSKAKSTQRLRGLLECPPIPAGCVTRAGTGMV